MSPVEEIGFKYNNKGKPSKVVCQLGFGGAAIGQAEQAAHAGFYPKTLRLPTPVDWTVTTCGLPRAVTFERFFVKSHEGNEAEGPELSHRLGQEEHPFRSPRPAAGVTEVRAVA